MRISRLEKIQTTWFRTHFCCIYFSTQNPTTLYVEPEVCRESSSVIPQINPGFCISQMDWKVTDVYALKFMQNLEISIELVTLFQKRKF